MLALLDGQQYRRFKEVCGRESLCCCRKTEEGASDLRKSVEKLSKDMEGYEKEYQVTDVFMCQYQVKLVLESHPYKEGLLEALQKVSAISLIFCTN